MFNIARDETDQLTGALKAMLIIPRTPSPEPEVPLEERDFDTLTADEQRKVFKRMQVSHA